MTRKGPKPFSPEPQLTLNAMTVLQKRYLWRDKDGKVIETPAQLFERVARAIAQREKKSKDQWAKRFYELMATRRFMPNTPTLINAGRKGGQLSACYVLPVEDSLDSIFDTLKYAAKIHQSGGGTGFAFSRLRPSGSVVKTTHGVASGPVSFIRIYDTATETIKQGGARRGANMAILRADHPDIFEFVDSKRDHRSILNFNISVGATAEFMEAVAANAKFALREPQSGQVVREIQARELFDRIVQAAWECGDPGMVFLDRINQVNPTPKEGPMESTNPCVTGDTKVQVEGKGWAPIVELLGKTPRISSELNGNSDYFQATQVVCSGIKPVYLLKTYEGYQLKLTGDHPVMTSEGDISAEELEEGAKVRLMKSIPRSLNWETLDSRVGEVMGWLVGDGHFTLHEQGKETAVLSFYGADKQEAAGRLLETVQGLIQDKTLRLNEVKSRDLAYVRSQRLRVALRERGVDESSKKQAPESIFRGTDELVSGFLRGLFSADGSVQGNHEKGTSVRLSSIQEGLLRDVQLLLLRLGMKSTLYLNRRAARKRMMPDGKGGLREYSCVAQHELVVSKSSLPIFANTVGFLIKDKQDALISALSNYRKGPYAESFYATVESLELIGEEPVYDLTEPQTSHFYANGILVHNCGEQPLLPFESCNLGSLNLGEYFRDGQFDWKGFREDIHVATRFLDNVVDLNVYPIAQSKKITLKNRKIGLGVMGFADLLLMMKIPYATDEAFELGEKIMSFLDREAKAASAQLAKERGAFPNWKGSMWERLGYPKMRNATVTTVAPTGTISIIAGASSGIEPLFSGVFYRNVLSGEKLIDIHPAVEKALEGKSLQAVEISDEKLEELLGKAWSPAQKIPVEAHVKMQSVFQKHSDSAVSKTINLPESAKPEDVRNAYRLAYDLGCKGITVYRDKSRPTQVLERVSEKPSASTDQEYCPSC